MTRWIAGILFGLIYEFTYLLIPAALSLLFMYVLIPLLSPVAPTQVIGIIGILVIVSWFVAILLAGIRAKCAVDEYGERDKTLVQAHLDSKYAFRMKLSFLPLVGRFFEEKKK
jgi:hypothetical protein